MALNISSDYKQNQNKTLNKNNNNPSFKGMEGMISSFCTQAQTGEIAGPVIIDIFSMIVPRTAVDASRNKDAGRETFLRETFGFVNNCIIPGFVAIGVGSAIGAAVNRKIKVNPGMPVNSDTLKMYHNVWNEVKGERFWAEGVTPEGKKEVLTDFVHSVLKKSEGLVGISEKCPDGKVKFTDNRKLAETIAEAILHPDKPNRKQLKEFEKAFINHLGASEKVYFNNGSTKIDTKAVDVIRSLNTVGRGLLTKFNPEQLEPAIQKISKAMPYKTGITLAIVMATGAFQQYINRKLTQKRTGSDAFVGLSEEARKQADAEKHDKKKKRMLKVYKALSIGAIATIAVTSLAKSFNPRKVLAAWHPTEMLKKLEFNSPMPKLDHLRSIIYPTILVGRVCASSDSNEVRETDMRDIPGYLNWLVLGPFVAKFIGKKISKDALIKVDKPLEKGAGFIKKALHFIQNQHLMSHSEINANKMLNEAEKLAMRKKLNWAIAGGLAYSTAILGYVMPTLNKHITTKLTEKKKKKLEEAAAKNKPQQVAPSSATNNTIIAKNNINVEIFSEFIKPQIKKV